MPARITLVPTHTHPPTPTPAGTASFAQAIAGALAASGGGDPAKAVLAGAPSAGAAAAGVVKALNNVSAYALANSDPLVDVLSTVAASDSPEAAE